MKWRSKLPESSCLSIRLTRALGAQNITRFIFLDHRLNPPLHLSSCKYRDHEIELRHAKTVQRTSPISRKSCFTPLARIIKQFNF
jgi:hypothetical protein